MMASGEMVWREIVRECNTIVSVKMVSGKKGSGGDWGDGDGEWWRGYML